MLRERALPATRYAIVVAVLGSLLASLTLLLYGGWETVATVWRLLAGGGSAPDSTHLTLTFIEVVDLFLLGTVFYIVALGLYELFIDDRIVLPSWLEIRNLDDLKEKLISVVIVAMGVLFLGETVSWDGKRDILALGIAMAFVIAALTWFLRSKRKEA